ncbi:MAG: cell division protein FtsZ [Cytophagales bacterium]|nr:cell division protein FtsZ [Cytophagales bacterium]
MKESTYRFDLPTHYKSIIKVMGVGGGGSNAVNNMFNRGIKDVSFVVCNTDVQALERSSVQNRLQIGTKLTGGLGAGANPEVGRNAAVESKEDIKELLADNTKMLFITAGMGGGTGTGAAPVIAEVAKELAILTVGIVTLPFSFEGKKKLMQANEGIKQLKENCDTVLVILNDRLREVFGNLSISNAFAQADNILTTAAKSIAEIITVPGYVNVDFEDVKTVMKNAGAAVMGSGQAEGERRALRAAEEALASPLLDYKDIHGAKRILLSIVSGEEAELQMDELSMITDYIQEQVGVDAEVIFGHGSDSYLGESIRVTVIATGFEEEGHVATPEKRKRGVDLASERQIKLFDEQAWAVREKSHEYEETGQPREMAKNRTLEEFSNTDNERRGTQKVTKQTLDTEEQEEQQQDLTLPLSELEQKKQHLRQKAAERVNNVKTGKDYAPSNEEIKEKLEVPAYLRKNVQLQAVPPSSKKKILRYQLKDDSQLRGDNTFSHDKVD